MRDRDRSTIPAGLRLQLYPLAYARKWALSTHLLPIARVVVPGQRLTLHQSG